MIFDRVRYNEPVTVERGELMKRCIICIVTVLVLLALLLSRDAIVPSRFTGNWYLSGSEDVYDFREGIIQKNQEDFPEGAYAFTRDTITLFVTGQGDVRTLYWVAQPEGDILSADPKGKEPVFYRNPPKTQE